MCPKALFALALVSLVAACSGPGGAGKVRNAGAPIAAGKRIAAPPRQAVKRPPLAAAVHMTPGLEGVIGATAADLTRQFGAPRLDVWEGDARKLQFSDTACILDVYLYPGAQSREPQATYVDARRASDGRDVDKVGCVASLKRR